MVVGNEIVVGPWEPRRKGKSHKRSPALVLLIKLSKFIDRGLMEHENGLGCLLTHRHKPTKIIVIQNGNSPNKSVEEVVRRIDIVTVFVQVLRNIERQNHICSHEEKVAFRQMSSWACPYRKLGHCKESKRRKLATSARSRRQRRRGWAMWSHLDIVRDKIHWVLRSPVKWRLE